MNTAPTITLAYSPCPNDTFMFHDIESLQLALQNHTIDVHMHDVAVLNAKAQSETFDISKLSFHAFLKLRDRYCMLNSGNTLGYGCGPLVITRKGTNPDMNTCKVAVPGELTTAHLLFQIWEPGAANRVFMPFDRIMQSVLDGETDAGVIIHEGRFTYEAMGLDKMIDLGEWWQARTELPIPLGCIAAKQSLAENTRAEFEALLRQSILNSQSDPEATYPYVREHAQEMATDVLQAHIDTYVNDFTLDLTDIGRAAVTRLEEEALSAGIL